MAIDKLTICLDDIDESVIYISKTGRRLLDLDVMRSKVRFKDHRNIEVFQGVNKKHREDGKVPKRLGDGKTVYEIVK
jgi:hypothetical protein